MHLRAYEKPLLAAILILLTILGLMIWREIELGAEVSYEVPASRDSRAAPRDRGAVPGQDANRRSNGGPRNGPLLCASQGDLLYQTSSKGAVAVAADAAGHFTLYGAPHRASGRPTAESYDLLRDCETDIAFPNVHLYNHASLLVHGETLEPAGEKTQARPSRVEDGAIVSEYRFGGGIRMRQRLSLRAHSLKISYRLMNRSGEPATVSLRALLNPPAAVGADDPPPFVVPALAGVPAHRGGGAGIRYERNLLAQGSVGGEVPAEVRVPRREAASVSSGRWTSGLESRPIRVTFAGSLELSKEEPYFYPIRLGWPLPEVSSMAVYWSDLRVGAGKSRTVSHAYGLLHPPDTTDVRKEDSR